MNALTRLLNEYLQQHNITRNELAHQLGLRNTNKFNRKLDEALNKLIDPNDYLVQITCHLKIPQHLFHAAYSEVTRVLIKKQKDGFQPSVDIFYQNRLGRMKAWGRSLSVERFKLSGQESISQQFELAFNHFKSFKEKYDDTTGFCFNRTVFEGYVFNNEGKLRYVFLNEHYTAASNILKYIE